MRNLLLKKIEKKALDWIAVDRFLPLQIDITNHCNLKCRHCYHSHHNNQGALSLNDWLRVIEDYEALVKKMHFRPYLILCGGEPLTSPLLKSILDSILARRSDYRIAILSNGILVQHFDWKRYLRFERLQVQVSLDGPDAAEHDFYRGQGSFDKTVKGIHFLQQQGVSLQILTVLSSRTAQQIPQFFALAQSLGVRRLGFTRLISLGHASGMVEDGVDRTLQPHELKRAYLEIIRMQAQTKIKSNSSSPLFSLLHPQMGRSGRFAEGLVVDYQGRILASSRSRLVLGSVFKDGLESVFLSHPILRAIRGGQVEKCGKCALYKSCGGDRNAAFAAHGDYLGEDPGCWKDQEIKKIEEGQRNVQVIAKNKFVFIESVANRLGFGRGRNKTG